MCWPVSPLTQHPRVLSEITIPQPVSPVLLGGLGADGARDVVAGWNGVLRAGSRQESVGTKERGVLPSL